MTDGRHGFGGRSKGSGPTWALPALNFRSSSVSRLSGVSVLETTITGHRQPLYRKRGYQFLPSDVDCQVTLLWGHASARNIR